MALAIGTHAGRRRTFSIRAVPEAVAGARERVVRLAAPHVDAERLANLRLVISEVITNAVRHGAPGEEVLIAVTPKDRFLCIQVTDQGDGFVPRPAALGPHDDGGFGLFLVEQLTRRWGLTRENAATRVWFEFDFAEG
jgi:anti-sigma regulatory factor (Ser/Thr protein kinase)